jgi:hypothetical protein
MFGLSHLAPPFASYAPIVELSNKNAKRIPVINVRQRNLNSLYSKEAPRKLSLHQSIFEVKLSLSKI